MDGMAVANRTHLSETTKEKCVIVSLDRLFV